MRRSSVIRKIVMFLFASAVAIAAGLLNPVQSGLTGTLQRSFDRPFLVAAISLSVSLACALAGVLLGGNLSAAAGAVFRTPWWAWLAGFAGFGVLIARPISAPHLGATAFTGLTFTAAIVGALLLDQFGLVGFAQQSASPARLAGAALMVVGAALVCTL